MGFFSDLKEDLSQAVNELMPEDMQAQDEQPQEQRFGDLNEMLDRVDSIVVPDVEQETLEQPGHGTENNPGEAPAEAFREEPEVTVEEAPGQPLTAPEESLETELAAALEEPGRAGQPETDMDLEKMLESALAANDLNAAPVYEEEKETVKEIQKETKGESKVAEIINARMASDETSSITAGMTINGDVVSEGSLDLIGCVNGNIDILGKLNVTGYVNGNSKAAEIYADNAKVNGEIVSEGAVKIGSSSVVIGNICATSAVIAGAVKGDIDVKGPVILDTSAIVMGNIKSKSVQINNGAVIEGMCSQCYAEVNPISFFDDYKPEVRKTKTK